MGKRKHAETIFQQTVYLPVFVYGTLRTGQNNWERVLKDRTKTEIDAFLPKSKMYWASVAFVTDAQTDAEQVVGNLVWIDALLYAEVLEELDRLENYDPVTNTGTYLRVKRPVVYTDPTDGSYKQTEAWVYYGSPDALIGMSERNRIVDGDWLKFDKKQSLFEAFE